MALYDFGTSNVDNPFSNGVPGFSSPSGSPLSGKTNPLANNGISEFTNLQEMGIGKVGGDFTGDTAIKFPGLLFREDNKKTLVFHRYPHQDGADIENMGIEPPVYHIRAILTNNIFPATNESWKAGTLFPTVFNQLLTILQNNSDLSFSHPNPAVGSQLVQVRGYSYELNPKGPRDGAFIDIELVVQGTGKTTFKTKTSPISSNSLRSLDGVYAAIPSPLNPPGLNLSGFFSKVAGIVDAATGLPNQYINAVSASIISNASTVAGIAGSIISSPAYITTNLLSNINAGKNSVLNNSVVFAVNYDQTTYNAVQSLLNFNNNSYSNAQAFFSALTNTLVSLQSHYISQNNSAASPMIENLRQAVYQTQQSKLSTFSSGNKISYAAVKTYVTLVDISWHQLALKLNNNINDLLSLNTQLFNTGSANNGIWVRRNTTIKYYQA